MLARDLALLDRRERDELPFTLAQANLDRRCEAAPIQHLDWSFERGQEWCNDMDCVDEDTANRVRIGIGGRSIVKLSVEVTSSACEDAAATGSTVQAAVVALSVVEHKHAS